MKIQSNIWIFPLNYSPDQYLVLLHGWIKQSEGNNYSLPAINVRCLFCYFCGIIILILLLLLLLQTITTTTIIMMIKRICEILDFAVPADPRINLKECEKKDTYLDLVRELKKLRNMKVRLYFVIGAFGTITKGLLKGLEDLEVVGRVETIQMRALLRTARILRRVLETWGDLLSPKIQ